MEQLDLRLVGPLQEIARLALERAPYQQDYNPGLDLCNLRKSMVTALVVPFVRKHVEALSGGEWTVREVDTRVVKALGCHTSHCVICPFDTPEGVATRVEDGMFAFAVSGAVSGYIPLEIRR